MEKRELSYTVNGDVNWCSYYGEQYGVSFKKLKAGKKKKLKAELPYDPAIPLLGIYSEKTKTLILKGACTPIFIAALFTIAKTWNNLNVHQQRNR